MKIQTGKYEQQYAFGITFTNYHKEFKAVILEFGRYYMEIIFKDYENNNM